ncbi:MAG: hypothetical protein ACTS5I_10920 [Rhodanobacter sp.]
MKSLERFDMWLNERDIALVWELEESLKLPLRDGVRDAARDAIDRKRERLATALNLLDEYRNSGASE